MKRSSLRPDQLALVNRMMKEGVHLHRQQEPRRWGKDLTAFYWLCEEALSCHNNLYLYVAPTYPMLEACVWNPYVKGCFPDSHINEKERELSFETGSKIIFVNENDYQGIMRVKNLLPPIGGVVFSECKTPSLPLCDTKNLIIETPRDMGMMIYGQ